LEDSEKENPKDEEKDLTITLKERCAEAEEKGPLARGVEEETRGDPLIDLH